MRLRAFESFQVLPATTDPFEFVWDGCSGPSLHADEQTLVLIMGDADKGFRLASPDYDVSSLDPVALAVQLSTVPL